MWVLQGHLNCQAIPKKEQYIVSQEHSGTCIPEESSCFINVLLGPLPGNERLQQVAYAKEDKPCVVGILVIAIAKLCILEICTLKWQLADRGCGNNTHSYSDHLAACRVLQVMCCLVAVSQDGQGQKRQQRLCCFHSHLLAFPTGVLWRFHDQTPMQAARWTRQRTRTDKASTLVPRAREGMLMVSRRGLWGRSQASS